MTTALVLPPPMNLEATAVVWVHVVPDAFRPGDNVKTISIPWRAGLRVCDVEPDDCGGYVVAINQQVIADYVDRALRPDEHVTFINVPHDPATLAFIGSVILATVVAFAVSQVLSYLFLTVAKPPKQRANNDNGSSVYSWGPISTVYSSIGLPWPVILGQHRFGGHVLSAYVEVVDDDPEPISYLYVLMAMHLGTSDGVDQYHTDQDDLTGEDLPPSFLINGNPAFNYDDVTVHLRMGSQGQAVIPGFDTVRTQYEVDLPIVQTSQADIDAGESLLADWEGAATWDMPVGQTADALVVGLTFAGLYEQFEGEFIDASVTVQFRYRPIDNSGTPTGPYRVVQFGAFQEIETFTITETIVTPFTKQVFFKLFDTSDATSSSKMPYTNLQKTVLSGWDHATYDTSQWLDDNVFTPLAPIEEFSMRMTYRGNFVIIVPGFPVGPVHPKTRVWNWSASPSGEDVSADGFSLLVLGVTGKNSYDVRLRYGSSVSGLFEDIDVVGVDLPGLDVSGIPQDIGITYKRGGAPGGLNRVRLFVNGFVVGERFTSIDVTAPTAGTGMYWNGHSTLTTTTNPGQSQSDFHLFDRELTEAEYAAWNAGPGLPFTFQPWSLPGAWVKNDTVEPGMVLACHFDNPDTSTGTHETYTPNTGVVALVAGSPTTPTFAGWVLIGVSSPVVRDRYRLQVDRTTAVQSDAFHADDVRLGHTITVIEQEVTHAGVSLVGVKIKASDQLNSTQPVLTSKWRGANDCPVWDGVDAVNPTFSRQYTQNPAWHLAWMLGAPEDCFGRCFHVSEVNWPALKVFADNCDELVYDQRGELFASRLEIFTTGTTYRLRLATPIPVHYKPSTVEDGQVILNKYLRVDTLHAGAVSAGMPAGDFPILSILPVDATTADVVVQIPQTPTGAFFVNAAAARVRGIEPRMQSDVVFADRGLDFWEAVNALLSTARAAPVLIGDRISVHTNLPRPVMALFNDANILPGSFELDVLGEQDRFNRAIAEFQSEDLDYARDELPRSHASLQALSNTSEVVTETFDWRGIVRPSQVRRELEFLLNSSALIDVGVKFSASIDAAFLSVGDVIAVQHRIPEWSSGGRCPVSSIGPGLLPIDHAIVLGTSNLARFADDLSNAVWVASGDTGPTVSNDASGLPRRVTFPAPGASVERLQLTLALEPVKGTTFSVAFDARLDSGTASDALRVILAAGGAPNLLSIKLGTLTGSYQSFSASGSVGGASAVTNLLMRLTLQVGGAAAVVDFRNVRVLVGSEIVDFEQGNDDGAPYYAAVRDNQTDAVETVATTFHAGRLPDGFVVPLASDLTFTPRKEDPWAIGPDSSAATLFQIVGLSVGQNFETEIQAVKYDPAAFPDEDAIETVPPTQDAQNSTAPVASDSSSDVLPPMLGNLTASEQVHEDGSTGVSQRAIVVSWRRGVEFAGVVASTAIWLRETEGGAFRQVAMVQGAVSTYRIDAATSGARSGRTYEVVVQPITSTGMRRSVRRCQRVAVTLHGLLSMGRPVTSGRVELHGDRATYRITGRSPSLAHGMQIYRGDTFIGQEVGVIPVGSDALGPTDDWCALPAAADGRANLDLNLRPMGRSRARGNQHLVLDDTLVPSGFLSPSEAVSIEDGPWDTTPGGQWSGTPVLTDLEQVVHPEPTLGRPQILQWPSANSSLTGSYTTGTLDMGRDARWHLSVGATGAQIAPWIFDELPAFSSIEMRSWTPQGFTDPNHPQYDSLGFTLEWAHSDTASPGSSFEPVRPGFVYFRSAIFRLSFTRPGSTWNMQLTRFALSVRELPRTRPDDFDGGVG